MDQTDENGNMTSGPDKILVTGATGFIGGHVVRYFASQGFDVRCLIRPGSNISFIKDLPVRFLEGDITDPFSLENAMQDIDAIVHTAGKVDDWGSYDEFYRVNVNGTLNVLRAAVSQSIKKVIITGSVSSYGEEHHPEMKSETSPYHSHYPYFLDKWLPNGMNHYRDTKAISTQKAEEFAGDHQLDVIVIEPVWVYGENEFSSGFYEYMKSVKSGIPLMLGRKSNNFHVVYAGDLARAYYVAYQSGLKGFHRFIIGNRMPENMLSIYRMFCKEAGLRKPRLLPKSITYPIALIMEICSHAIGAKKPPLLTRARVNMFYDSIGYDTTKAKEILQFEALTPLDVGISKTVKWYRENNHL